MKNTLNKIINYLLILSFIIILPFAIRDLIQILRQKQCNNSGGTYIEKADKSRTCIFSIKKYA